MLPCCKSDCARASDCCGVSAEVGWSACPNAATGRTSRKAKSDKIRMTHSAYCEKLSHARRNLFFKSDSYFGLRSGYCVRRLLRRPAEEQNARAAVSSQCNSCGACLVRGRGATGRLEHAECERRAGH